MVPAWPLFVLAFFFFGVSVGSIATEKLVSGTWPWQKYKHKDRQEAARKDLGEDGSI